VRGRGAGRTEEGARRGVFGCGSTGPTWRQEGEELDIVGSTPPGVGNVMTRRARLPVARSVWSRFPTGNALSGPTHALHVECDRGFIESWSREAGGRGSFTQASDQADCSAGRETSSSWGADVEGISVHAGVEREAWQGRATSGMKATRACASIPLLRGRAGASKHAEADREVRCAA